MQGLALCCAVFAKIRGRVYKIWYNKAKIPLGAVSTLCLGLSMECLARPHTKREFRMEASQIRLAWLLASFGCAPLPVMAFCLQTELSNRLIALFRSRKPKLLKTVPGLRQRQEAGMIHRLLSRGRRVGSTGCRGRSIDLGCIWSCAGRRILGQVGT